MIIIVALNDFADLTNKEYQAIYLGTHIDGTERLKNAGTFINVSAPLDDVINWANKGAVTGVKNQGQCGSCCMYSDGEERARRERGESEVTEVNINDFIRGFLHNWIR